MNRRCEKSSPRSYVRGINARTWRMYVREQARNRLILERLAERARALGRVSSTHTMTPDEWLDLLEELRLRIRDGIRERVEALSAEHDDVLQEK